MSFAKSNAPSTVRFPLSAAAERACAAATQETRVGERVGVRLLASLAIEPETLAGRLLQQGGVELAAVESSLIGRLSATCEVDSSTPNDEFETLLQAAWQEARRNEFQQEIGTEHLLLGVLACDAETAAWLADRGVDEASVRAAAGLDASEPESSEPVPWPFDEETSAPTVAIPTAPATEPEGSPHFADSPVWRLLDASANRCTEGLRVVEDYVRFIRDDAALTEVWKSLRHELAAVLQTLAPMQRVAARAASADVGRGLEVAATLPRTDLASVARANCERVKQSLRSLEEFSKVVEPAASLKIERLRYRAYEAEQATLAGLTDSSKRRIADARLYVLLDARASESEFGDLASAVLRGGADAVQLRDKGADDRLLLERGRLLRKLADEADALFIFNDRADLALATGADGVHVGQEEASIADCRRVLGDRPLVGVSTHSCVQLRQAVADGASYVGLGPTFASSTKSFSDFAGLEFLRRAAEIESPPAFAIGGITLDNLAQVLAAGVRRVAVGAAVTVAADPEAAAKAFADQLRAE